jgi:hypothetical protein
VLGVGENRVFRDGMIHVHAEKCHTCIFRPGNVMHLRPGRVKGMVEEARQNWSVIPCHETLGPEAAVCAGYAGLRADPSLGADRIVLLSALGDNLLAVLFGVAGVVMAFFGYWAATFMMCTLAWRLMYTARRTTRRITQSI